MQTAHRKAGTSAGVHIQVSRNVALISAIAKTAGLHIRSGGCILAEATRENVKTRQEVPQE
jgi:hypothetical protein